MVRLVLWLAALAVAVWAHRPRTSPRDPRSLLVLFAGAVIAWRVADLLAGHGSNAGPHLAALQALPALALWTATIGLVGMGARKRDLWTRGIVLGIAFILGSQDASIGAAIAFTIAVIGSYRWRAAFHTRALLRVTLGAVVL